MRAALLFVALIAATPAAAQNAEHGHSVFDHWCAPCHGRLTKANPMLPGTTALQDRYKGSVPAALEDRTDLSRPAIRTFVRNGVNAMPPTRKTEISDADLDDLAAYLTRNNPARR